NFSMGKYGGPPAIMFQSEEIEIFEADFPGKEPQLRFDPKEISKIEFVNPSADNSISSISSPMESLTNLEKNSSWLSAKSYSYPIEIPKEVEKEFSEEKTCVGDGKYISLTDL